MLSGSNRRTRKIFGTVINILYLYYLTSVQKGLNVH